MRTNILKKFFLVFVLVLFVLSSTIAFATDNTTTNEVADNENNSVSENAEDTDDVTYIESDLFLFDTNIEISNYIDGNVAIYGGNVTVNGEIQGDLIVIANSLIISEDAKINGNLLAYASELTISGTVSGVYAASSDFVLEETGTVLRNLDLMSTEISLYGKVNRDANLYTSNINFSEDVDDYIIGGTLNYWAYSEITIPEGIVNGQTFFNAIETSSTEDLIANEASKIFTGLCLSFAIIMLSIWISPEFRNRIGVMVKNHSIKSFLIGLFITFVIIVGSIFLLLFTAGFGSTIAVLAIALFIITYAISGTVFAMSISSVITNKLNMETKTAFVLFALLIVLIISLLKYIPYVGLVISMLTSLVGIGLLGMNFYQRKKLYKTDDEEK